MTQTITINKDDLYNLIRKALRAELDDIQYVSNKEQEEIDALYKDSLQDEKYDSKHCVRL
ncbi:MAG: hypothetical protein ACLFPL_00205 [Candidatus Nanoarchaeia archaeon]